MSEPLNKRRAILAVACVVLCFGVIAIETTVWKGQRYYLTSLIIVVLSMLPFFIRFESSKPQAKELVLLAVMTALAVAGREAFYWLPQFKPVCAIAILTAIAFDPSSGFICGASAGLISNFFMGQGPWTPWQMLGFGLVAFLGGVIFHGREVKTVPLLIYGFFSVLILYGVLLDTASLLMATSSPTWKGLIAMCASGFWFNVIHAAATVVFLWLLKKPLLTKLERVKVKYGIFE